ncbi:hypothetical protein NUACC21_11620 [Scytonema sp. NUACC21]
MKDEDKTKDQLIAELVALRQQIAVLEASEAEHKETLTALKESEEHFRLAVEDVRDYAIFMLDTSGHNISWNAGVERILGYSEVEFIGQHSSRIFTREDIEDGIPEQEMRTAETEGRAVDERWHIRKDSTRFWASGIMTALRDKTGKLKGFTKVMRDFTDRKQAEEERAQFLEREQKAKWEMETTLAKLQKSEARFRRFAKSGMVGVIFSDVKGNIADANEAFLKMVGYTREDLLSGKLSWYKMTPEEYLHRDSQAIKELRESGVCTPFEKEYIRKDGSRVPIVLGAALLEGSQDNAVCFVLDITRRKWAESSLQTALSRLHRQLQFTKAITSSLGEGVYAIDNTGCVTFLNAAAEQILGWIEAEILGKNMHNTIHFQHADGSPILWEDCQVMTVLQSGKIVRNELDVFTRKDGTIFPVAYTASPIVVDGQIIGAVIVFQDITERKRVEQEHTQLLAREQAARNEAEKASRLKDEFLATVSHELRTPLNAILGWVQLLRRGKLNEAAVTRALETIERNARLQNQIVEDILDVSRIIRGKLHLQIRPVKLIPVIDDALDAVRLAAEAKGIELTSILESEAGPVAGDSDRLQQVVWNLLSNAIKFTPKGGCVSIQLQRVNSDAVITVSDTGQGISAEFLPYIFDRFSQADATTVRSHSGLGLGLAIVRHLVELHGGTVVASSPGVGKGATFTVHLPVMNILAIEANHKSQVHLTQESDVLLNGELILDGLHILVVDDEADAREMLTVMLQQSGAKVKTAGSVGEAMSLLERLTPDVLVSDLGMPVEDGYTLIRQVRERLSDRLGQIPALALTAYARAEDRTLAISAGFQMHLPKPVQPQQLVTAIANLAGKTSNV